MLSPKPVSIVNQAINVQTPPPISQRLSEISLESSPEGLVTRALKWCFPASFPSISFPITNKTQQNVLLFVTTIESCSIEVKSSESANIGICSLANVGIETCRENAVVARRNSSDFTLHGPAVLNSGQTVLIHKLRATDKARILVYCQHEGKWITVVNKVKGDSANEFRVCEKHIALNILQSLTPYVTPVTIAGQTVYELKISRGSQPAVILPQPNMCYK